MSTAMPADPRATQGAARLLDHFDTLRATPDDVARLEAAILHLAVQGKLVPQDPDDEPATELLERICVEKDRLIDEGKKHKTKTSPFIVTNEIPYELPVGWIWCRLEDLFSPISTREKQLETKEYQESGRFAVIGQGQAYITAYSDRADKVITIDHPVIVFGDHTREIKYVDFDFIAGADGTKVLSPFKPIYEKFFYCVLRSYRIQSRGYARHYKGLIKKLFPLPPLAEQKRIVAKVDALLAQTRALAAQLERADAAFIPAAQAAFGALPDAPDVTAQRAAWQRVADHFDALTNDPRTIAALKQTILQLAVEGKLVPQNPEDEPASVLVERILAEHHRHWEQGHSGQRYKEPVNPDATELPQLPNGWVYTFIQPILSTTRPGMKTGPFGSSLKKYEHQTEGVPVLGIENIGTSVYVPGNKIFVTEEKATQLSNYDVQPNDILISRSGTVGEVCIVPEGLGEARFSTNLVRIVLEPNGMTPKFFRFLFNGSPLVLKQISELCSGTTRIFLNQKILSSIVMPLPPLAEQKRIVAKVEALLGLCDALAAGVVQAEAVRGRVLQAVLNGGSSAGGGR